MKTFPAILVGLFLAGCAASPQPALADAQLFITPGGVVGSMLANSIAIPGSPTTTTQSCGDTSTKVATTAFAKNCTSGGSSTITANSTLTSAFSANTLAYSDGTKIQAATVGSGLVFSGGTLSATGGGGGGTVTVTGSTPTIGHCAQFSGATSIADTGATCGGGGGSGTVASGTSGQLAYYASTGTTVSGLTLVPVASGGTGTASPSLVAGTNVTITGSWPNQTVNSTGGGGGGGDPGITYVNTFCGATPVSAAQTCINSALASAVSTGKLFVQMDCGTYNTTGSIVIPADHITFQGKGFCTTIAGSGNFDTLQINPSGTTSGGYYGNQTGNFRLAEGSKSGGYGLNAAGMSEARFYDMWIDSAVCGARVHDVNNLKIERWVITLTHGVGCQAMVLSGGGSGESGRTDVVDFIDTVFSANIGVRTGNTHGLIIDGDANTISAHKIYFTAIDGHGLWIRNAVGATSHPQFASFYGMESDFNYGNAIKVEHGNTLHFTDLQTHGSAIGANISLEEDSQRVTFTGGFTTGACTYGIDIRGSFESVSNMQVLDNSSCSHGSSPGVHIAAGTGAITLTGNTIGGLNAGWQSNAVLIDSGANYFTLNGNTLFNNAAGIQNNAGSSATQVVINGAQ